VGRSPLIQSLKLPRGIGGFRCLCYYLELVLPAQHCCCRLELASWRCGRLQLIVGFMPGTLPYSDGQCGRCCCHCVRLFVSEANQPTIYYYTMHSLYAEISAMGSSCEQHQSHLKEIKFMLTNSWNNLSVLFSAIVPVACARCIINLVKISRAWLYNE
jgi:hypothetical protein